jgi:hypothetical protein
MDLGASDSYDGRRVAVFWRYFCDGGRWFRRWGIRTVRVAGPDDRSGALPLDGADGYCDCCRSGQPHSRRYHDTRCGTATRRVAADRR